MSSHTADGVASTSTAQDEPILSAKSALKEIALGSVAGMVAEVFEYPFDLAKTRLQAQLLAPTSSNTMRFEGPIHCLTQTWKEEGVRGLYRGLPAPMVGAMAETAALFVAYSSFQNVIRSYSSSSLSLDGASSKSRPLSIPQLGLASAGAGFVTSFVLTPIELVKCKMQVQLMNLHPTLPSAAPGRIPHRSSSTIMPSTSSKRAINTSISGRQSIHDIAYRNTAIPVTAQIPKLPGPIALTRSIIEAYGVRGMWLGHTGTLLRETGGCASWFVTKEWIARKFIERRVGHSPSAIANAELMIWESGVSGAIAGAIGALMFYPADTVKSAIQTEEELRPKQANSMMRLQKRSTFIGTFRKMWLKHGMKGLYAGCGMTVARAVPSSGIIFVVYDGLSAWFS